MDVRALQADLRRIRLKHWYTVLAYSFSRLQRHSLVIALCLGAGIPVILTAFLPLRTFLVNHDPASNVLPIAFIQALSWFLVLVQKNAILHDRYERYLNSLPLPSRLRSHLTLQLIAGSNHLLWTITLPVLVALSFEAEAIDIIVATFKVSMLYCLTFLLQLAYLESRRFPWLRLALVNALIMLGYYLYDGGEVLLSILVFSLAFIATKLQLYGQLQLSPYVTRKLQAVTRLIFNYLSPWVSLYFKLLFDHRALSASLRVLLAIILVSLSSYALSTLSEPYESYRFWAMFYTTLGFMWVVNGLYYQFEIQYVAYGKLLDSLPVSSLSIHLLNVRAIMAINLMLGGSYYAYAQVNGFSSLYELLFCGTVIAVYTPLMYFIAVKSTVNTMAYTALSISPLLLIALVLFG